MKKPLALFPILWALFFFQLPAVQAQVPNPQFLWGNSVTGAYNTNSADFSQTAIDPQGNAYALAESNRGIILNGTTYPQHSAYYTQVLVKYDSTGQMIWQHRVQTTPVASSYPPLRRLAADNQGSLFVIGYMPAGNPAQSQYLTFDQDTILAANRGNYFIIKLSASGQIIWSRQQATNSSSNQISLLGIHCIDVGVDGDLYIGATAYRGGGTALFDTVQLLNNNGINGWLIARLDGRTGIAKWARSGSSLDAASWGGGGFSLKTDQAGDVQALIRCTALELDGIRIANPRDRAFNVYDTTMWFHFSGANGRLLAGRMVPQWGDNRPSFVIDPAGYGYLIVAGDWQHPTLNIPPVPGAPPHQYPAGKFNLMKLNPMGAVEWVSPLYPWAVNLTQTYGYGGILAADQTGQLFLASVPSIGQLPLPIGHYYVSKVNPADGSFLGQTSVSSRFGTMVRSFTAAANGRLAIAGRTYSDTTYLGSELVIARIGRNQFGGVVGGLDSDVNLITGSVFVDANANNVQDNGERGYPFGSVVELSPGGRLFATSASGAYAAPVKTGTYALSLASNPLYHTVTPLPPANTSFSGLGQQAPGASFALRPIPGKQDLQVFLYSYEVRSITELQMSYRNVGTVPVDSGTLVLNYDTSLTYHNSTRVPDTIQPGRLVWRFRHLLPGQSRAIGCQFYLHFPLIDSTLTSTAVVTPLTGDLTPADNVMTVEEIVNFPYPWAYVSARQIPRSQVQNGTANLTYTARFQNPFADSVYRITLRDTLPAELRGATVDVVNASHPTAWTLTPGGILEIRLDGARLAGTNAGPQRKGAFVQYRLKPQTNLPVGTRIINRPAVYLDGQLAFPADSVVTVVVPSALGTPPEAAAAIALAVWPNPAAEILHLEAELAAGPIELRFLDATGRVTNRIQTSTRGGQWRYQLPTTNLAPGLYLVEVRAGNSRLSRRVMISSAQ